VLVIYFLILIGWDQIFQAVTTAPRCIPDQSVSTCHVQDFNLVFLIGMAGVIYGKMSWQGTQGYNSSAKSAH
jgi:hypothetical protein